MKRNIMAAFVIKIKHHWEAIFKFLIIWHLLAYQSSSQLGHLKSSISSWNQKALKVLYILLLSSFFQFSLSFNHCSFCSHYHSWTPVWASFSSCSTLDYILRSPSVTVTNTLPPLGLCTMVPFLWNTLPPGADTHTLAPSFHSGLCSNVMSLLQRSLPWLPNLSHHLPQLGTLQPLTSLVSLQSTSDTRHNTYFSFK